MALRAALGPGGRTVEVTIGKANEVRSGEVEEVHGGVGLRD